MSRKVKNMQTQLKKFEQEVNSFELWNLFPSMRNKKSRRLSEKGNKVRDHVMVLLDIKEDEIKKIQRSYEDLKGKYKGSVEKLKSAEEARYKCEEERKLLRSALDRRVSSRREAAERNQMKNDKEELLRRLNKAEKEYKGLQAKVKALRESLDDALLDVENKVEQSCCAKEDTDAMCKRLYGAGMSTGEVQKFIEEMCLLVDGKLKLAFGGCSRSYLDNLRRDLLGENRLLCAIVIGMCDEIKQINHDDSNVGDVTITTTFLGLKVPWIGYEDGLAGLHLDCAGLPEGKDAEAGASYILEEFDKMREELRKFKNEYLPSLGEHDLASQLPNVDEVTITKAALGCVMCADNASAAQAKSRTLMRKVYRLLNPGLPQEALDAMSDGSIQRQLRCYIVGCIIHERRADYVRFLKTLTKENLLFQTSLRAPQSLQTKL